MRRKERQKRLKKERQALGGLPPSKKTRLEDGDSSKSKEGLVCSRDWWVGSY